MQIEWVIDGVASERVSVDTTWEAHTALCRAVKAAWEPLDTDALAVALGPVYALRQAMVTEGRMAVARGDEWSAGVGTILVRLLP
jgi:hypothetical protein